MSPRTLKGLLVCGIISSLFYVIIDLLAGLMWQGYSFIDDAVSELSAIGAVTRPFVVGFGTVYGILVIGFGLGVLKSGRTRAQQCIGGLLIVYALVGYVWNFFPIHMQGLEMTFTDVVHSYLAAVTVLLVLLCIGLGVFAFRNWFRFYSIATFLILLIVGAALGIIGGAQISAQGIVAPPKWFGLSERINIYGFLLWTAILSYVFLRTKSFHSRLKVKTNRKVSIARAANIKEATDLI